MLTMGIRLALVAAERNQQAARIDSGLEDLRGVAALNLEFNDSCTASALILRRLGYSCNLRVLDEVLT